MPDAPHALAVREARALVAEVRGGAAAPEDWGAVLSERVARARRNGLRRVINATGVVLHTNLGRAPLSAAAAAAVADIAEGWSNLELDLASGERGERLAHVVGPLRRLTGAEDAVAVNNNAAAVLLALTAIAAGREVVVSRGELVEIGGSFRIPEVIAACGARLVEVGATNRTRASDFAGAIGPHTAAILRVHPSNFKIVGFASTPTRAETAAVARAAGVAYIEDLGSGALAAGLGEPTVAEVVGDGADLVCVSGDKLLGGPQAGLVVGRAELVGRLRRHPLYRALRLDRLVLAALEATLRESEAGEEPPAVRMIRTPLGTLRQRADGWAALLRARGARVDVVADEGFAGGGALPGEGLPTWAVAVATPSPDALARALRLGAPPVMARVRDATVRLDPRTVPEADEGALLEAVCAALGTTTR